MQHRLGLRDRGQMVLRDQPADRDRAQIGHKKIVARLQFLCEIGIDAVAEAAGAIERAEEDIDEWCAERARIPSSTTVQVRARR